MCLIVAQPAGAERMTSQEIKDAWQANPDGAGYAFAVGGVLHVRKAFFKLKKLIQAYRADWAATEGKATFLVHFRMATHGSRCPENTHPFLVGREQNLAVAHNGVLPVNPPADWSDTRFWLSMVYGGREVSEILHPESLEHVGQHIGRFNKFALLPASGTLAFVNEEHGLWERGSWYSSQSARGGANRYWGFGAGDLKAVKDKERTLYRQWAFEMAEDESAGYDDVEDSEETERENAYDAWADYLREYERNAR